MWDDTIAAVATALGEAGLAIIRISGGASITVAGKIFVRSSTQDSSLDAVPSHTVHYGKIVQDGQVLDEVLVTVMRAPRTFTREDTVEIACHGGVLVTKTILDAVLANGARLALPGEFTRRAFLNGRIDLTQAEAVADLIHARSELAMQAANAQLAGGLSYKINTLRDDLMKTLAHIEAHIDFPDEDIAPDSRAALQVRLESAVDFVDELLRLAKEGQILRRGVRAAIIGEPNVGKSSLLNQLLGRDRAIVSPIPGTTRDTIEETANIGGIPITFVDTAGLRDSVDMVEQEGMRRSLASATEAELILYVVDASSPVSDAQRAKAWREEEHTLVVRNKIDLGVSALPTSSRTVDVSCVTGQGIEALKDAIKEMFWSGSIEAEMIEVMINARHQNALHRARAALLETVESFSAERGLELIAVDLRAAASAVGEIVGKTCTDDLLDAIFSQFCLGK